MNKKLMLSIVASFVLFASLSFSSAYMYGSGYPNGNYDSYSYSSTRSQGNNYGPSFVKTTDYNRFNSEQILPDGTVERTTQYMRTNRETPNYNRYNRYYRFPASNYNYGNNYNYGSNYNDNYWYRRHWNNDNMGYSSYRPMMYYSGYAW